MHAVSSYTSLRSRMAEAGRHRFSRQFDVNILVEQYRQLLLRVAPPTLLVDMDGVAFDLGPRLRGTVVSAKQCIARADRAVVNPAAPAVCVCVMCVCV